MCHNLTYYQMLCIKVEADKLAQLVERMVLGCGFESHRKKFPYADLGCVCVVLLVFLSLRVYRVHHFQHSRIVHSSVVCTCAHLGITHAQKLIAGKLCPSDTYIVLACSIDSITGVRVCATWRLLQMVVSALPLHRDSGCGNPLNMCIRTMYIVHCMCVHLNKC